MPLSSPSHQAAYITVFAPIVPTILDAMSMKLWIDPCAAEASVLDAVCDGHAKRVRRYSTILAYQMLSQGHWPTDPDHQFIHQLDRAAPLHDIGKRLLPPELLEKPAPLSQREYRIVQTHTTLGADFLTGLYEEQPHRTYLPMASQIAMTHHEHWDGTGYPAGLSGADIPLAGRIVAVADVYDALTSRRVYKPALDHASAKALLLRSAGRQFDPRIIDAFVSAERSLWLAATAIALTPESISAFARIAA
jgi:putative two-component system response regulator